MTGPREDATTERARLEAIAYGPGSTPEAAAHARIALSDLAAGRRVRGSAAGQEARPTATTGSAVDGAVASGTGLEARPATTEQAAVVGALPRTDTASSPQAAPTTGDPDGDATASDRTAGATGDTAGDATAADHPAGATGDGGGEPGLQAEERSSHPRFRWSARRSWLAAGAAAAVGVAFASGIAVGAVRPDGQQVAAPSPSDGAITVTQLLDAPQSFADRLPVSAGVPVVPRTTRLVFTNRSLSGDDAGTPWNVWAGVGEDRTQICFIASADRIESSGSCYPRDAVLAGQVLLTAQSSSGVLQVRVVDGVVRGTVTDGT